MSRSKLVQFLIAGLVLVGLGIGVTVWWLDKQRFVATENAFVQTETVSVSPQIEGYVAEVLVADNQRVEAGAVLVRLDASDARARLDQALARAAALEATVRGVDDKALLERAMISERLAGVTSAEAAAERDRLDLARYGTLARQGWVSDERLQETRAGAAQSSAALAQAKAALEAERQAASSLGSERARSQAEVAAARADIDKARLDLDRTVIRAPATGVVGARSVRPGQYVRPGGQLLALVPLGQAHIIANFKETQLAKLRVGQPVDIRADAFGDRVIPGRVESFAPATGQEFALIPVENAVGNFTKIAQRLPVRIAVAPGARQASGLRPGMSVKVRVDVRDERGAGFADAAAAAPPLAQAAGR